MQSQLDLMLDVLAPVLQPIVDRIEATPATTKDHYGDYMAAIPKISAMCGLANDRRLCLAIGLALNMAGANKEGVASALKVLGHL